MKVEFNLEQNDWDGIYQCNVEISELMGLSTKPGNIIMHNIDWNSLMQCAGLIKRFIPPAEVDDDEHDRLSNEAGIIWEQVVENMSCLNSHGVFCKIVKFARWVKKNKLTREQIHRP